jgi:hypothetical protein
MTDTTKPTAVVEAPAEVNDDTNESNDEDQEEEEDSDDVNQFLLHTFKKKFI